MRVWDVVFLVLVAVPESAAAGAWIAPPERSLAILKLASGADVGAAPTTIAEHSVSLFVERGVSSDLSVEILTGVQMNRFDGSQRTGPGEQAIGVKYRIGRWRDVIVSGYLGERVLFDLGVGPFAKDRPDWRTEARGLVGTGYRLMGHEGYVDLQATALIGHGERLQVREDSTLGVKVDRATTFTLSWRRGEDRRDIDRSAWTTVEATTVRTFGPWRIEAGWRRTVTSPWTTITSGPVLAIWRSF